jgi:hypothetical protein
VVQIGCTVEEPIELRARHPDVIGDLFGRCLWTVVGDCLKCGLDELGATFFPLTGPAGRAAVDGSG